MFRCLKTKVLFRGPLKYLCLLGVYKQCQLFVHNNCPRNGRGKKICNSPYTNCFGGKPEMSGNLFMGKYLIITNTLVTGTLMGLGDLIQQHIEYVRFNLHKDSYDWERAKNMVTVGLLLGPITHSFYRMLDRIYYENTLKNVFIKLIYDTAIATPFYVVFFFVGFNLLSGIDFQSTVKELKRKFLNVFTMECCVWIPCQFINFLLVPPKFRVIFINVVALCHNVMLSYLKNSP